MSKEATKLLNMVLHLYWTFGNFSFTFYQYVQPDGKKESWDQSKRNLRSHLPPLINFIHSSSLELIGAFCIVYILIGYVQRLHHFFPFQPILYATISVKVLKSTYNYAVPLLKIICGSSLFGIKFVFLVKQSGIISLPPFLCFVYSRFYSCYINTTCRLIRQCLFLRFIHTVSCFWNTFLFGFLPYIFLLHFSARWHVTYPSQLNKNLLSPESCNWL